MKISAVGDLHGVSIHAPVRGATKAVPKAPLLAFCFNPRAREGRDLQSHPGSERPLVCFNPRAREGRDYYTATCRIYTTKSVQFAKSE